MPRRIRAIHATQARLIRLALTIGIALIASTSGKAHESTAAQAPVVEGTYDVTGTNPDGSRYSGTCRITRIGQHRYQFAWSVGASYRGIGTLVGTTLTVEWGSDSPAVYQVRSDGVLVGTWAKGTGTETLIPRHAVDSAMAQGAPATEGATATVAVEQPRADPLVSATGARISSSAPRLTRPRLIQAIDVGRTERMRVPQARGS
jgi:hypothetical protein